MKKQILQFFILSAFLFGGLQLKGQTTVNGGEFITTICDIDANSALNLGWDVVGSDLNISGGTWHQVNNSVTTGDLDTYAGITDSRFIKDIEGGVFVLVGKPVGTYTFVYTATNNVCLQPVGSKVIARITIVETAKDIAHRRFICPGETDTVKLRQLLPYGLVDDAAFDITDAINVDKTGTPSYLSTSGDEGVIIPADWVGTFSLEYYNGAVEACNSTARITVTVEQDFTDFDFTPSTVSYCANEIPDAINLYYSTGTSADEGIWKKKSGTSGVSITNGLITFTDDFTSVTLPKTYVFTYAYDDCGESEVTKDYTIIVTDDITLSGTSDNICRTDHPEEVYDLMKDGMGLGIDNSAGTWTIQSQPNGNVGLDVSNGLFNIGDARIGTYEFLFKASNAGDICGLSGSAVLTVNLGDISGAAVSDGRLSLCVDHIANASTGNLKLSDYITGLAKVNDVEWTGPSPITGSNSDEVAFTEINKLGAGTHKYTVSYTTSGCDGPDQTGEGFLYITLTSRINLDNIELDYCRPDLPSGGINLYQALGVYLPGDWTIDATAGSDATADNLSGAVFNETGSPTGEKTYTFKFTSSGGDYCNVPSGSTATVTIIVRDNSFN